MNKKLILVFWIFSLFISQTFEPIICKNNYLPKFLNEKVLLKFYQENKLDIILFGGSVFFMTLLVAFMIKNEDTEDNNDNDRLYNGINDSDHHQNLTSLIHDIDYDNEEDSSKYDDKYNHDNSNRNKFLERDTAEAFNHYSNRRRLSNYQDYNIKSVFSLLNNYEEKKN